MVRQNEPRVDLTAFSNMEPKIFWSAISGRGRAFKVRALILMGDWCGEERLPTLPERNTGKGEEQALTEALRNTAVPCGKETILFLQ